MNETATIVILVLMLMLYAVDKLFAHMEKQKMQQTVSELTNKLMAKDYREYVSMQPKPQEPEKPRRKPLSYFDDPDVDPDYEVEDRH